MTSLTAFPICGGSWEPIRVQSVTTDSTNSGSALTSVRTTSHEEAIELLRSLCDGALRESGGLRRDVRSYDCLGGFCPGRARRIRRFFGSSLDASGSRPWRWGGSGRSGSSSGSNSSLL
jgi:hypothetical protein